MPRLLPLLNITDSWMPHYWDEDTRPSEPGPGDQLMQELVTRLELASDKVTREVVATILEQLLRSAWPGRWTTSCPLW